LRVKEVNKTVRAGNVLHLNRLPTQINDSQNNAGVQHFRWSCNPFGTSGQMRQINPFAGLRLQPESKRLGAGNMPAPA